MRDLIQCRDAIDEIDTKILKLLAERMNVATDVALYKLDHNQPITDRAREQQKLLQLSQKGKDLGLSASYITDLYKCVMSHTVAYEQQFVVQKCNDLSIKRDTSVAYLGTIGTYSHLAARRCTDCFNGKVDAVGCQSFSEIVGKVETRHCEFGVLPIENSSSGNINDVLDVLQNSKVSFVGELFMPIDHSILTIGDVQLQDVTDLYSHPQPITQCSRWLKDFLPNVTIHYTKATSEAMEYVAQKGDPHCVAIGSHQAAPLYKLNALVDNIANNIHNFTRFVVISMTPCLVPSNVKAITSLSFSVQKFVPGSLIKVLNEFSDHNINLTKLISRPRLAQGRDTWEEIFFADVDANLADPAMQEVLATIKDLTSSLKILGCYQRAERQ